MSEEAVAGTDLIVFSVTDAGIAELAERYLPLTIKGIDDKPGFDAVHRARIDIKTRRVSVQKDGKAYREKANIYLKKVLTEEKRVLALLEPIEDHLSQEESRITEEIARIKAEADAREAARIKVRVDQLYKLNCRFDGTNWAYAGVEIAAQNKIAAATDEQFAELVKSIQDAIDEAEEALRLQEEARLKEQERLNKIAEEQALERQRLELVAKQQKEEQDRLEKEREEAAAKIKAEQEEAEKKLAAIQAKIKEEQENIEREKQRIVDAENARIKAIEDAKIKAEQDRIRAEELEKAKKEAAAKALAEAEAKAKADAEAKAKKEAAAKLAAERKEARRPDKAKLMSYIQAINAVPAPELKTSEGVDILTTIHGRISGVLEGAELLIEEL